MIDIEARLIAWDELGIVEKERHGEAFAQEFREYLRWCLDEIGRLRGE